MKLLVFCALVFVFRSAASQTATIDAILSSPDAKAAFFMTKKDFVLTCNVSKSDASSLVAVTWQKEGKALSEVEGLKGRFSLSEQGSNYTLTVKNSQFGDAGNWSCSVLINGEVQDTENILVASNVEVKIKTENVNVVEEEKLRIECSVLGNPHPSISWKIESGNYNGNVTTEDRIAIQDYVNEHGINVENGVLLINPVNLDDRGVYYCVGQNKYYAKDVSEFSSMVRIKGTAPVSNGGSLFDDISDLGKYAPLWPFLGICTEVIVLCAIIIIYEKRRNKSELEESDTDQSPDQ